jgi:hypothetical protein
MEGWEECQNRLVAGLKFSGPLAHVLVGEG